jgi:hypothetical protein
MSRHGYTAGDDGSGPHTNVLGHPLLQLPLWIDAATDGDLDDTVLFDILESSLCGYLSVRAEDDYFDGQWDRPKEALMLSGVFRSRHQGLLARHVSDERFWNRFEELWSGYADAMLLESELTEASSDYGPVEFDMVLARSQPLEIPADAVLSLKGCWDQAGLTAELVRHLTKATQLFDDLVDAPGDLASGNYTWMVRRLAGTGGEKALRRGMVKSWDQVITEAAEELDRAVLVGAEMGLTELLPWIDARKAEMERSSRRMFEALFEKLGSSTAPELSGDA